MIAELTCRQTLRAKRFKRPWISSSDWKRSAPGSLLAWRRDAEAGPMALRITKQGLEARTSPRMLRLGLWPSSELIPKRVSLLVDLAISRRFCQMMGGEITVATEPGAFLATDEASARKKSPARAGLVLGTSSQARAQSSASMAGLGRRKGKAPVVTPEGLDRGKVGLRAVCAFSNTQTVRFRYRDISANWPRRGAPRSGGYLRGGRSASYGLLRPRGRASDIRRTVRFLRRHEDGRSQAPSFGGVAETFDARNRGARVRAMDI